ncbi:MAG: twin-arginine translocase subunit TatC [Bacteroidota bacterium]
MSSENKSFIKRFKKKSGDNPNAEMSFVEHLEDLRWHVVRSLIAILAGSIIVFAKIEYVVNNILMGPVHKDFITYRWLCLLSEKLQFRELCLQDVSLKFLSNAMTEQFLMTFSLAFTGGFVLAFPYVFWQLWRFISPALSKKEKKYTTGAIVWVSLLFFTGVLFGYIVLTPFMVNFYSSYSLSPLIEFRPSIGDYFENLLYLTVGVGILFQLPVVILMLTKIGIISPFTLKQIRKYAFVVILILAAAITPSTDPFSLTLVTLPLYMLYEFSIILSARAFKKTQETKVEQWD